MTDVMDGAKSLDEVDPEIRATFDELGISLAEQERLSVDHQQLRRVLAARRRGRGRTGLGPALDRAPHVRGSPAPTGPPLTAPATPTPARDEHRQGGMP